MKLKTNYITKKIFLFFKRKESDVHVKMSEYVFQYFKKRFPSDQMSYEWCYNLNDACERFVHNENIQFFRGVLNEQVIILLY